MINSELAVLQQPSVRDSVPIKRPYNVLLVNLARSFGGAEVRVLTLAAALQDSVANCTVAVLKDSALCKRLEKAGLPFVAIPAGRSSPKLLPTLRTIIREGHYHIVDAHNVQSILWGHLGAFFAGAKGRITTVHSDFGAENPGLKGKFYESVLLINRVFARQYVNVTEVLQAKSERQGLGGHASLIPNAVPVPEPMPVGIDYLCRSQWGFDRGDFVVGIVARLNAVKGHTYLIDALAQLDNLPCVKLVILGDGPLRADLEAQVNERGLAHRVCFAGFREDITSLLPALDMVCMASLSEALPYAVLEAASYARPILATAVGGMATLLEDHETALLVPPRESTALAQGIRWFYAHPEEAKRIGENAYHMVRERFSVQTMVEKTLHIYDESLS